MVSLIKHVLPIVLLSIGVWLYLGYRGKTIPGPIVTTSDGQVRGIVAKTREGLEYYRYLGIPYAKSPSGQLRFEDPQPNSKFQGIFEANQFGAECLQFEMFVMSQALGDENCLSLNIYAPKIDDKDKLVPVMVYVHGGAFMMSSSTMYTGDYLVDENVILVAFNYRLGALGFLSSGDEAIRGNMGLKDQVLALKWLKDNIQAFGGDPAKILLFGESAGGSSVYYQLLSSQSQNLFSKVISMSPAFRLGQSSDKLKSQFQNFATKNKCPIDDPKDTLKCLKAVEGKSLVETHGDASEILSKNEFALFRPSIESKIDENSFLTEAPTKILESGNFQKIPCILGVVKMDGLLYVGRIIQEPSATKAVNENWIQVLPKLLGYDPSRVEVTKKIVEFYFSSSNIENLNIQNNIEIFSDLFTDRLFLMPLLEAANIQSKFSPVFIYYLTYKPKTNIFSILTSIDKETKYIPAPLQFLISLGSRWIQQNILGRHLPVYGPGHGDELSLLFNMNFFVQIKDENHVDYAFSKALVKLWTDWAKSDNDKLLSFNGDRWEPYQPWNKSTEPVLNFMELNTNGRFRLDSSEKKELMRRIEFWNHLDI